LGFEPAFRRAALWAVLALMPLALPGCSQLVLPNNAEPVGSQPPYASMAAKYLQSSLKDTTVYDGFEISAARWVSTIKGWSWLTCVRFDDHGHKRIYAIFIQNDPASANGFMISDAHYAVATDSCEAQAYTPFDLISGALGRPTAPVQQPLY
jgi:hypothetical protein